ncbi:hypothetical protein [Pseudomonas sp. KK18]|uniref:hypothetical protein n=1 Tax=Pseudomonas sp. KK18 TaxID=3123039 RepID=UPI0030CB5B99
MRSDHRPMSPAFRRAHACGMVLRHAIGQVRAFEARLLDNVARLTGSAWHKVAKLLLDVLKVIVAACLLLMGGWVLSCVAILAILYTVIGSYRITRGADYLWYEAYGDPYGEYELNRAAGQPDIEK